MSRTLNLCEHLLARGRQFCTVGAFDRAQRIFTGLARLRDLPDDVAEETQSKLAEFLLRERKFAKARRHLAAALEYDNLNPIYHHLMAIALEDDPRGDRNLALKHYRRSRSRQNTGVHVGLSIGAGTRCTASRRSSGTYRTK